MNSRKLFSLISFFSLVSSNAILLELSAQIPKGQFYSFSHTAVHFCQVDGDHATGYNKIGYSLGYMVGQGLGKDWCYESGITYSVRGSRRQFNPDNPAMQSFNLHYSMIDIPVKLVKNLKKFSAGAGLITMINLTAEDKDGFILHLNQDTRKYNMMGAFSGIYRNGVNMRFFAEYQYSLNSIRILNNSNNPFFRTGVYHHVISLGFNYLFGQ